MTEQPLVEPSVGVGPPSRWASMPLLGGLVAASREVKRQRQRRRLIWQQIAARRHSTRAAWGDDSRRRAVAAAMCETIQRVFGWPNAHFLPDDRLGLLMREFCQDALSNPWRSGLARHLGTAVGETSPQIDQMTLGQLVDYLLRQPQRCPVCGYDLRASPDRCPECGTPRQ